MKNLSKNAVLWLGLLSLTILGSCQSGGIQNVTLSSDQDKQSYAIGVQMGKGIKRQEVDVNVNAVALAIKDVLAGGELKLTDEEVQKQIVAIREQQSEQRKQKAEASIKEGQSFLEENKKKDGVKVTESGLQYEVLKEGTGKETPKADDKVKVHYKGTLLDGSVFDSSYEREKPAEFRLNQVIKGWTEGVSMMTEGAKWKFYVPAELAYGPAARPGIPGNSVLIFEVELLEIL